MKHLTRNTIIACLSLLLIYTSCDKNDSDSQTKTLKATTIFKSSSLATQKMLGFNNILGDSLALTPYNIDGEALSLLFATASEIDEGLVIFGDGRPDIAPSNSVLLPFDFATQLPINSSITLKPGYAGGDVQHMVSMFGYIDIYVTIENANRTLRLALGDYNLGSNTYVRGDVLLQDTISYEFEFYDLDNFLFTAARPSNPTVIEEIRDFFDPIRPNMVYYPLNVFLDSTIVLNAGELQTASSIDVVVDFFVENFMVLQDQAYATNISDSAIINSFDLSQNIIGYGNSGLSAHATFEINQ